MKISKCCGVKSIEMKTDEGDRYYLCTHCGTTTDILSTKEWAIKLLRFIGGRSSCCGAWINKWSAEKWYCEECNKRC